MSKAHVIDNAHLPANPARCPAIRLHSSMNFSTSLGSNLRGLRPGPIFTAGRYGFRLPDACCTTHEMLTPSFLATSAALMSCRIGFTSAMTAGKIFACSIPFTCCMLASHTLVVPSCFLFTEEAELCQTDALLHRSCTSSWRAHGNHFGTERGEVYPAARVSGSPRLDGC